MRRPINARTLVPLLLVSCCIALLGVVLGAHRSNATISESTLSTGWTISFLILSYAIAFLTIVSLRLFVFKGGRRKIKLTRLFL